MSDLQNLTPANTFKGLLQVGDYTNGVDSTVKAVLDGEGTASALAIGTTNVGIGTTSPSAKLDIKDGHILVKQSTNTTQENILLQGSGYELNGSLYGNVSIRSNYDNATNAGSLNFYSASSSTNTTERMRIDSNGKVGIGTSSPSEVLDVVGSVEVADGTLKLNTSDRAVDRTIEYTNAGSSTALCAIDFGTSGTNNYLGHISLKTKGTGDAFDDSLTEAMRITSDGKVGIGTASPDAKLHLSTAGTDGLRLGVDSQTYYHTIRPNGDGLYLGADDGDTGGSGADIRLNVKGDEKMRIDSEGNVGIGTVMPGYKLHIAGGTPAMKLEGTQPRIWLSETDETDLNSLIRILNTRFQIDTVADDDSTIANRFTILNSNGNIGINTDSPSAPLEVASTTGGVIMPRMNTSQRTAISASNGEMVYDTDLHKFYGYANGAWTPLH